MSQYGPRSFSDSYRRSFLLSRLHRRHQRPRPEEIKAEVSDIELYEQVLNGEMEREKSIDPRLARKIDREEQLLEYVKDRAKKGKGSPEEVQKEIRKAQEILLND